jgi:hypothetical protein
MKSFRRSVSIPPDWKLFVQKRLAQQENQEEKYFQQFSEQYEEGILRIAEQIQQSREGVEKKTLSRVDNVSFVHRHKITGEILEMKRQPTVPFFLAPKCVESYRLENVLELIQYLIVISLRCLKGCENFCPLHQLVEHFGSSFGDIYQFLQCPLETQAFDQMAPALKTMITEGIYGGVQLCASSKFFFESLRPVELTWMCTHPHRFLSLVDTENSSALIGHHLTFFRNLSLMELTYLSFLPEEGWNHFKQILDHKEYQDVFSRYHVFAVLALSHIIHEKNRIESEVHPLLDFYRALKPFFPLPLQLFFENHSWSDQLLIQTFYGFQHGDVRYWMELQTLPPEQSLIKTLIYAEPLPTLLITIPQATFQLKHNTLAGQWIPCLSQQMVWNTLEKQIETQPEPTYAHPYWREWKQMFIKSMHVQARDLIDEARRNQECILQKNYYPTYYQYWTYFVFGWVIVVIIFVLFLVALLAYSIQKTYPTRYYIKKMSIT